MSKRTILLTLSKKTPFLNLSNINNKIFVHNLKLLKGITRLFKKKGAYITREHFNTVANKIFLNTNLYLGTSALKGIRRKGYIRRRIIKRRLPKISSFINQNPAKFKLIHLFNSYKRITRTNLLYLNLKIVNKFINKKFVIRLVRILKPYLKNIFNRRINFFLDVVKMTSLYLTSHIDLKTYCKIFISVFVLLHKKLHQQFFKMLKLLFSFLILKKTLKKRYNLKNFRGLKLVISGRLKGKTRAKSHKILVGNVPTQTFSNSVDYVMLHGFTYRMGTFGFKFWVCK